MNTFKITCVGNASPANRGCEAIARGTASILRVAFGNKTQFRNAYFSLPGAPALPCSTDAMHEDLPCPVPVPPPRFRLRWAARAVCSLTWPSRYRAMVYRDLLRHVRDADFVLSIGGDNYSLDYGVPYNFIALDRFVRDQKKPLVIWGASIGPFTSEPVFEKKILRHLRQEVTAIFAREPCTVAYLRSQGFSKNLHRMPDPAFLLEPSESALAAHLPLEGAIGINLSPLMSRFITNGNLNAWVTCATEIVKSVRDQFDNPIILIPHVTAAHSDDHAFMARIAQQVGHVPDLHLVPPTLNAGQTKGLIARLGVLLAARMHASIAGLSSAVPTVSLAYSVKARGIHDQVLGTRQYVLDPEAISADRVCATLADALRNGSALRTRLEHRMTDIRAEALQSGHELREIIASC